LFDAVLNPLDFNDQVMHAFSGVWAVNGSGVVYVDANSSYLAYIQHGTHKVRRETPPTPFRLSIILESPCKTP
jgi:hypothetical protein